MKYVEFYDPSTRRWYKYRYVLYLHDTRSTMNLIKIIWFLNVDCLRYIKIITVFFFSPPWKWPQEGSKHVSGKYVINLHSYSHVGFFLNIMYLINTRNVEHIKQVEPHKCGMQPDTNILFYVVISIFAHWCRPVL